MFLTSDYDIISCGNNASGLCGFDQAECSQTSVPFKVLSLEGLQVTKVAAGLCHSLFLTQKG